MRWLSFLNIDKSTNDVLDCDPLTPTLSPNPGERAGCGGSNGASQIARSIVYAGTGFIGAMSCLRGELAWYRNFYHTDMR
jgi:hypothetical protein